MPQGLPEHLRERHTRELLNPFASDGAGVVIHIDMVDGSRGPFTCPHCSAPLRVRAGKVRRKHFAHDPGRDCFANFETYLHYYAKDLINRRLFLMLPERRNPDRSLSPRRLMNFDRAVIEPRQTGFRPDLMLTRETRDGPVKLHVEIWVSHKVSAAKREAIKKAGVSAVEIDLRKSRHLSGDALDNAILRAAPRAWIYNRLDPEPLPAAASRHMPRLDVRKFRLDAPRRSERRYDPLHPIYPVGAFERRGRSLERAAYESLGEQAEQWLQEPVPGTDKTRILYAASDEAAYRATLISLRGRRREV